MKRRFALIWAATAMCVVLTLRVRAAESPDQVRRGIAPLLVHHVMYVHHAYEGSYLHYDGNGRLLNHVAEGMWADTGAIYPNKVELNSAGLLHIEADRVAVAFDHRKGAWVTTRRDNTPVVLEMQFDPAGLTLEVAKRALAAVFASDMRELAPELPAYWQPCIAGTVARDAAMRNRMFCFEKGIAPDMQTHAPVQTDAPRERAGMQGAHPIYSTAPRFTDVAREFHFNGTAYLWLIVDEEGRPAEIYVVSPVGYGLDDEAVKALAQWRFVPAMLNGKPSRSQVTVDVNFKGPPLPPPIRGRRR